mgnify:CR=1 FL=1
MKQALSIIGWGFALALCLVNLVIFLKLGCLTGQFGCTEYLLAAGFWR